MTLKKAVEIQGNTLDGTVLYSTEELRESARLLFEAGKEIERNRPIFRRTNFHLLPGETKD